MCTTEASCFLYGTAGKSILSYPIIILPFYSYIVRLVKRKRQETTACADYNRTGEVVPQSMTLSSELCQLGEHRDDGLEDRVKEGLLDNVWDGYPSLETSKTRLPKISLYNWGPGRLPSVREST
jgi:hypothetical protein